MYQRLYSQKTPHILPSQVRYGVSFMRIRVKIDCVITAPHCVLSFYQEPVVVVQGLRKAFVTETKKRCCNKKEDAGIKVAVKNNNIMVMPGEVFGLLGPNGAGKTTTLNMVIAEEGPTAGKVGWFAEESRAANQYGISVFCTDFTCKIREYEFGLENTEIELCQFCHLKYCCQNKAYLFWVANQSGFVAFYALEPSNTFLITKTFNLLSSTCSSSMLSCLTSCSCSTGSIH